MKLSDLECLEAACELVDGYPDALGTGGMKAAAHGLRLIDAALARNLREHRQLERTLPGLSAGTLGTVGRVWPKAVLALRRGVATARRARR